MTTTMTLARNLTLGQTVVHPVSGTATITGWTIADDDFGGRILFDVVLVDGSSAIMPLCDSQIVTVVR